MILEGVIPILTNDFKMNNYSKFYSKTVIATTAIMNDNSKLPSYVDFTREVFCCLADQIHRHSRFMLELIVLTV